MLKAIRMKLGGILRTVDQMRKQQRKKRKKTKIAKPMSITDFTELWRQFLISKEMASYGKFGDIPPCYKPVLNYLLPSLLYVHLLSLLHKGLQIHLKGKNRNNQDDLNGCIKDARPRNHAVLHKCRGNRNDIGHELDSRSWDDLDNATLEVHAALEELNIVGAIPEFKAEYEKSKMRDSEDPDILCVQDHILRVLQGTKTVAECTSSIKWRAD